MAKTINEVKEWLSQQKVVSNNFLEDMRKHKIKAINPLNQGKIMASAGVVAFIDEELKFLDKLE